MRRRRKVGVCIPAADGYQYGVRYLDGSISKGWNGSTQQERAQQFIWLHAKQYRGERLTMVRREVHFDVVGPWEHADLDPWLKPTVSYISPMFSRRPGGGWRGYYVARMCFRHAEGLRRRYERTGRQQ